MKRLKKLSASFLCMTIMLGTLAGCGGSDTGTAGNASAGAASVQSEGKTKITVGVNGTTESIGPYITTSNIIKMIFNMFYMQLGSVDREGVLQSNLYTDFENTEDMHYVVTLKENIKDNDGNPITAEDIAFCYNKAKELGTSSIYTYYENAEATGEYTFEFDMTTDAVGALNQVMSSVNIVSQAAYEASDDEMNVDPVSCGPYVVREFTPGSKLVIEKADNFWCEDMSELSENKQANVDVIELQFITEETQLTIALQQGTVDAAIDVNPVNATQFESDSSYKVEYKASNFFYNIYFDCREGHIFSDENLRKAVCYAIDQEEVMYGATQGTGQVIHALATPYSSDYDERWDTWEYYPHDVEKAKEYLAAAGYSEGELTINLMCQFEQSKPAAEVIATNLQEIGINSEIICPDSALYSTYMDCTSDVWDASIMFYVAQQIGASSLNGQFNAAVRENGMTFSGISDPTLQSLVEAAISEDTYSRDTYYECQEYLRDKAYAYGLYTPQLAYVYDAGIEEIYIDSNGRFIPGACTYSSSYAVFDN